MPEDSEVRPIALGASSKESKMQDMAHRDVTKGYIFPNRVSRSENRASSNLVMGMVEGEAKLKDSAK